MTPTTDQLKDLLAKVTPAPWWTDAKYDGAEKGCAIIAARTDCGPLPGNPTRGMVAWSSSLINTEARRCEANATLIALAPTLAAEVVRLREALAIAEISVDGMSEVKAIADGDTMNTIQDVVDWVLARIARQALDATSAK